MSHDYMRGIIDVEETDGPAEVLCPSCGSDHLGTIEEIAGTAWASFDYVDGGGVSVEHDGETTVHWDSSTTVGVECGSCGWEHRGEIDAGVFAQ